MIKSPNIKQFRRHKRNVHVIKTVYVLMIVIATATAIIVCIQVYPIYLTQTPALGLKVVLFRSSNNTIQDFFYIPVTFYVINFVILNRLSSSDHRWGPLGIY